MWNKLISTSAPAAVILIRIAVGAVFLSEGIQKFLYPLALGAGRFATLGLPSPEILGPLVAVFEIICGLLVMIGMLTRLAVVPLLVIMVVAIFSTKIPMFADKGFWAMAHESRTDFTMLLASIFLLLVGSGRLSVDSNFGQSRRRYRVG